MTEQEAIIGLKHIFSEFELTLPFTDSIEKRSRNLNDQISMYPTPTTGAGMCGGTGSFQQLKRLKEQNVISEDERRSMSQGSCGLIKSGFRWGE